MRQYSTRNDEIILSALLTSPSITEAAEKCGITDRTIYRRLEDPEFKQRYDMERRKLLASAAASVQTYLTEAISTLGEIMKDKSIKPQIRLNAAEAVIRDTLKLTERADVLDRLDALENQNGSTLDRAIAILSTVPSVIDQQ